MAHRDEDELLGRSGRSPSFLSDDGAFVEIEDFDSGEPIDVEETPFLPGSVDSDGVPGDHPYAQASRGFDKTPDSDGLPEDDFAERVQTEHEAKTISGGDDLEARVRVQEADHQSERRVAPYVRINPPTAYQAILGGTAIATSGQDPQQVVIWQGRDTEATPVSVMFTPLALKAAPSTPILLPHRTRPFVRLQFGTRDALAATVDVDVGTGGQLTVPASAINVLVGLDPILSLAGTATYALAASVGYFPIVRTSRLTRTAYIDNQGTGAANMVVVPRPFYAADMFFYRSVSATSYTLDFIDEAGTVIYEIAVAAATNLPTAIQLSSDVSAVWVTNTGAVASSSRVIWGLNL